MIRLFKFFFSIFILIVLLVVADRFAARVAGQVVADRIKASQHLTTTPDVSVKGFPFLTQLVAGRYDHVDATAEDVKHGDVRATSLTLHLYGVHVSVADVLSQSVKTIAIDRANGTVLLSYADINALTKASGVKVAPGSGGTVSVSGTVVVGGQKVKGSGVGSVDATADGIRVTVTQLKTPGLSLALTRLLLNKLTFVIPNSDLPYGIKVKTVDVGPTGADVGAAAGAFVIPVG
jgi:LmeA-like phospholipid-binding